MRAGRVSSPNFWLYLGSLLSWDTFVQAMGTNVGMSHVSPRPKQGIFTLFQACKACHPQLS